MTVRMSTCTYLKKKKKVKKWRNFQEHISHELLSKFLSNLVCRIAYMKRIKSVNLIEIDPAVIEI